MSAAAFAWMRGSGGRRSSPGPGAGRDADDGAARASSRAACPLNRRSMRNTTRYDDDADDRQARDENHQGPELDVPRLVGLALGLTVVGRAVHVRHSLLAP